MNNRCPDVMDYCHGIQICIYIHSHLHDQNNPQNDYSYLDADCGIHRSTANIQHFARYSFLLLYSTIFLTIISPWVLFRICALPANYCTPMLFCFIFIAAVFPFYTFHLHLSICFPSIEHFTNKWIINYL